MWKEVVAVLSLTSIGITAADPNLKVIRAHVSPSEGRIIGGSEVPPHSVPFQVGLRINGNAFCGGALISPDYVLTAGHCGEVISFVDVILGAHNISNPDEETQVVIRGARTIIHEEYNGETYKNDITLIELSEAAPINEFIQVATLPTRADMDRSYFGKTVTATGWGLYRDVAFPSTRDMSDVLLAVDVAVANFTECAQYYRDDENDYVLSTNVCTSGHGNKGTCNGDSGGPLILDNVLIGLTSFGTELCEICSPSVYTRVVNYLDWIVVNSNVTRV